MQELNVWAPTVPHENHHKNSLIVLNSQKSDIWSQQPTTSQVYAVWGWEAAKSLKEEINIGSVWRHRGIFADMWKNDNSQLTKTGPGYVSISTRDKDDSWGANLAPVYGEKLA